MRTNFDNWRFFEGTLMGKNFKMTSKMAFRQLVRNLRKAEERMKEECPKGHTEVDFVDLGHKYTFCYACQQKYVRDDYIKIGGN